MAIAITITAESSPLEAIFKSLGAYEREESKLFNELGSELLDQVQLRFTEGVGVDGNPWVQSWRAKMQGGQTLRDKGILMNSYTYNVLPNGVEVGTNVEYAAPLHFGALILPKNGAYITFNVGGQYRRVKQVVLPPRTQLGINPENEESLLNIVGDFINELILRSS
ncbi:Phage virion morphogenesis (putative tail completion) protein [Acinetobacter bereziniae]|uniref:phage virion morphogenesis protein n=1 Tax=Acinetobacter bereziniae TaxID=106648 RepID=UPI000573CE06|nr:phage virion morphogenesis protein [Acinetobacter bereziniae]CEI50793.1 Phage virion morphogenesis (putative tail completion) protein [Acinetobacter bereziniae]